MVDGISYIFGDNKYVLFNTTIMDSIAEKKSKIIAYHLVTEGAEGYERRTAYVNTHEKLTDILTKVLNMSEKGRVLFWMLQHEIFGSFTEATVVA